MFAWQPAGGNSMHKSAGLGIVAAATFWASAAIAGVTTPAHIDQSGVNLQPEYPDTAIPNREAGNVIVRVGVRADGNVTSLGLVQSSGFDDLDSAAMNTARLWHYVPAMDNGNSADGTVLVQIVFKAPSDNPPPAAATR
jgi:protein TonB